MLVVGNPANTNALIAMHNAPNISPERFTAMTRLDQNRAKAQLAARSGRPVTDVTRMTIWGNHSATQYPDVFRARIDGRPAAEVIGDETWVEKEFIPVVQQRGAAVIEARGASSAASAASAALNHVHDWMLGTARRRLGLHGHCLDRRLRGAGRAHLVLPGDDRRRALHGGEGLDLDEFSRTRIDASVAELGEERDAVQQLGLLS